MGVLLHWLNSLFLVTAVAAGSRHEAAVVGAGETTLPPYYSSPSEVMAYWKTVLPNLPLPPGMLDHLSALTETKTKKLSETSPYIYWSENSQKEAKGESIADVDQSKMKDGEKSPYIYWSTDEQETKDGNESPYIYWSKKSQKKEYEEKSGSKDPQNMKGGEGSLYIYGSTDTLKMKDGTKSPFIYWSADPQEMKDGNKSPYIYWSKNSLKKEDGDEKSLYIYGSKMDDPQKKDGEKSPYIYWSTNSQKKDEDKSPYIYWSTNPQKKDEDGKKSPYIYWSNPQEREGEEKLPYIYGSTVSQKTQDRTTSPYIYWSTGLQRNEYNEKSPYIYWASPDEQDKKREDGVSNIYYYWNGHMEAGADHHHLHSHGRKNSDFDMANFLFTEDVLTPGTVVAPCIKPATPPAPFLRHDVADSIPMSTESFPKIMAMFAAGSSSPAATAAADVLSKIKSCEHARSAASGRNPQTCATSVEAMFGFVAAALGTRSLRAFSSSSGVPVEGVSSGTRRYTVAAARRVTAAGGQKEETTATCHGVEFPFAVFYCHAENPTRVYEVTLLLAAGEEEASAQAETMRVLAVCHLDTSGFDPAIPFFAERRLKPRDVPLCHFLEKGSILWAPTAQPQQDGGGHVAAR